MKPIRVPLVDRFLKKVIKTAGCWFWTGSVASGYGRIRKDGTARMEGAHRVAYELFKGPIPEGQIVLHECDVKLCVNPAHLRAGTYSDNMQDMLKKGRGNFRRGPKHA